MDWNFKRNSKQKSNFPEHVQYEIMYVIKKILNSTNTYFYFPKSIYLF